MSGQPIEPKRTVEYAQSKSQRETIRYELTLFDFSLLPITSEQAILSPVFFAKNNESIRWQLKIQQTTSDKHNQQDPVNNYLSVKLRRLCCEEDAPVEANLKFHLLKNGQSMLKVPFEFCDKEFTYEAPERVLKKLISLKELQHITKDNKQEDCKIKLFCQMDFEESRAWKDTKNIR